MTELSVIVPNHNGAKTIGACLEALCRTGSSGVEVVVVDDASNDTSVEIIRRFPCRLIRLDRRRGAAVARNTGAHAARGKILFFTDADCVVNPDTLARVLEAGRHAGPKAAIGGSYTPEPFDRSFFSRVQSVFIHYNETRNGVSPDYIATHAMVIRRETFQHSGGFPDGPLPILEDVAFSHSFRRRGGTLAMDPRILVRHIFGFSYLDSLKNAWRKSRYWTRYSLGNHDLTADSGTASRGLKLNVAALVLSAVLFALFFITGRPVLGLLGALVQGANIVLQKGLIWSFFRTGGPAFALVATAYYATAFATAVFVGASVGALEFAGGLFSSFRTAEPGRRVNRGRGKRSSTGAFVPKKAA